MVSSLKKTYLYVFKNMITKLQNLNKKIVVLYCYLLLLIYGIVFIIIVILLLIIGLIGSFFPSIPGPPISCMALLLSHFYIHPLKDKSDLWLWKASLVVIVTILDFWVQIYSKEVWRRKKTINGSILGLIIGFFFIPGIGLILGPFWEHL